MRLRPYIPSHDFYAIKDWVTDERTHAMWCADRFQYPLEKDNFEEGLHGINERCGDLPYVALIDDSQVGFFCYSFNFDTQEGMLKFVIVDPSYRGKGVATEMFLLILKHAFRETDAKAVQLMVFPQNLRAKRFYEKIGFKERRTDVGVFTYKNEAWDRCNMIIYKGNV